ncbi:hypothetical protein [Acuticoccus kalidii]|uniref:hypothetical protein n=1 Tax=Acuticoccus kalidii TaxID=2910977 RepID=UPI003F6FDD70
MRLIGAVLLEARDDWQLQQSYMQIEAMPKLDALPADAPSLISTANATWPPSLHPDSPPH